MSRARRFFLLVMVCATLAVACGQPPSNNALGPTEPIGSQQEALSALSRSGWTASASTTGGTNVASNALDGNATTRWRAGVAQATNQWFQVDMASLKTFTAIRLDASGASTEFPRNYRVQVANNNTSWGSAPTVATGTGTSAVTTITFAPQTARYVRVTLTAGNSAFWSIHEFNVYGTALSRSGWTVTASSTNGTNVASNAIDGNTGTRWSSAGAQTGQWFKIDMKSPRTFNQIVLDAGTTSNNFPRGYAIFVSNDDVNWGAAVATGTGTAAFTVATFPFQNARYIRIDQTATNSTTWSIQELSVEGQPTSQMAHPRAGFIPSASSSNGTNLPANALDGMTSTRWSTSGAQTGQWFQVDMLSPRIFDQITLDAGTTSNNFPRGYQVNVSNDGSNWTTVSTGTGSSALVTINLIPARTARYLRINQTATNTNPWSIQEMNITGPTLSPPGWVASASSTNGSNVPGNAIDTSTTTRWSSASAQTGQWFQVDMGTAQVFNQLTLDAGSTPNNFPRGYSVSVSNDGTNWGTPIATGSGTAQVVTITFPLQTARFFRIHQTATETSTWSIQELGVRRLAGLCDGVTCAASDQCHEAGVCDPNTGICSNPSKPDGTTCDDGNACTLLEVCMQGSCVLWGDVVTCSPPTYCHEQGTCDPATGNCSWPNAPDGKECDDFNDCTEFDTCTAGSCQGQAFSCVAPSTCHEAGTCVATYTQPGPPSTQDLIGYWKLDGDGTDSSGGGHHLTNEGAERASGRIGFGMKFDGTSCMTAPIWNEARMQGASGMTMMAWVNPSDEIVCPIPPHGMTIAGRGWDYSMGAHCYSASPDVAATGSVRTVEMFPVGWGYPGGWGGMYPNQWTHVAVTWDHSATTIYFNGKPVIGYPVPGEFGDIESTFAVGCMIAQYWTGSDRIQHFLGTIDEVMLYSRQLSPEEVWSYYSDADPCDHPVLPNGSACNDSNLCTQTDTCQSGSCLGSNPVVCTAQDSCHDAGTCIPWSGCSNPVKPDGVACNDGNSCTQSETCEAGVCQPAEDQPTILDLAIEDLGDLGGGNVLVQDINRRGDTVGSAWTASGLQRAFFRPKAGPMVDMGLQGTSTASGVNDGGWASGSVLLSNGWHAFRRDPNNGGIQDLGLNGTGVSSREINNARQVAGFTVGGVTRGFRYSDEGEDGLFEDVGTLADGTTRVFGIDDAGTVVGASWVPGTPQTSDVRGMGHAVMFRDAQEGLIDLNGLIDPGSGWTLHQAIDIAGDFIVGAGDLDGSIVPFRLRVSTGEIDALTGGFQGDSHPAGVNRFGDVVGTGKLQPEDTRQVAFVYSDRFGFKKLGDIVDPTSGWDLGGGSGINDLGEIVGWGTRGGQTRSFRTSVSPQSVACGSSSTCGGASGVICIWSDGIAEIGEGRYVAIFGFQNSSPTSVHPTTNEVRLDGSVVANPNPAPPQWFATGSHPGGYLPQFNAGQTVSWTVDGQTVTASVSPTTRVLPTEPIGQNGLGVRVGDTLVTLRPDLSAPPPQQEPQHVTPFNGALTGTLSVSPSGAATYSVPISIPPGIAGVAPNLSLVYNSQGGMGIAGQGWELAGLSMIHRCPKTTVQDGFGHQVSMDATDFEEGVCIDGKRMFELEEAPRTYKLEQNDYSTITKILDDPGGPNNFGILRNVWFKVVTKTGEARYYGRTASTRVNLTPPGQTTETAIWALERVVDQFGNYFDVQYNEGATNFATEGLQVSAIHYTGHLPISATGGVGETDTFAHVRFQYEPRREKRSVRFGSVTLPRTKRLKKIATSTGVYTLNYLPDYVRGQPYGIDQNALLPTRLSSIGYCALDNVTCMKPLDFGWDGGGYNWEEIAAFAPPEPLNHPPGKGSGAHFPDLDGDGRSDFVRSYGGTGAIDDIEFSEAWRNTGEGFVLAPAAWKLPAAVVEEDGDLIGATFADMDGDGLVDFVTRELVPCGPGPFVACSSHPAVWLNKIKEGGGWQRATGFNTIPGPWSSDFGNFIRLTTVDQIVDMNADGKADLVRFGPGDFQIQVKYSNGTGWINSPENYNIEVIASFGTQIANVLNMKLDDVNRDGLPDMVWKHGNLVCSNLAFGINTGRNHDEHPTAPIEAVWQVEIDTCDVHANAPPDKRLVGDLDGDGFRDIVSSFRTELDYSVTGPGSCLLNVCSCPAECVPTGTCSSPTFPCQCSCPSNVSVTDEPQVILATGSNWTSNGTAPFLEHLFDFEPHAGESSIPPSLREDFIFSMADLNADGLADAVINHIHTARPEGRGQLLVNTGAGFEELEGALDWNASAGIVDVRLVPRVPTADEDFGQKGRMFIDLNGDGVTDLVDSSNATGQFVTKAWVNRFRPPVIEHFPNGLAQPSEVTYSVITTAEAKQDGTYWDSPVAAEGTTFFTPPLRVVKSVLAEDGTATGTMFSTDYQYTSLRAGADGRGPQGFASVTVIDQRRVSDQHPNARKITETQFAQHYPYTGMAKLVRRYIDYGATHPSLERAYLTETATDYCAMEEDGTVQCDDDGIVDYAGNTSLFVHPRKVTDTTHLYDFDVADRAARTRMVRITDYDYDTDGNPTLTKLTTEIRDGLCGGSTNPCSRHEKTVTNFYEALPGSTVPTATLRRFGKVTRSIVNSDGNVTSGDGRMHTTEFDYVSGVSYYPPGEGSQTAITLKKTRAEPGRGAPLELHTAYAYDAFGNLTETLECPTNYTFCLTGTPTGSTPFRSTRTSYNPAHFTPPPGGRVSGLAYENGRFPVRTENALGHKEYFAYHPLFAVPVQKTGPNGIHQCFEYDTFGRVTKEINRCGAVTELTTSTDRFLPIPWDPQLAKTVTRTRAPTGVASWSYGDAFGRTTITRGRTFDGGFSETFTVHDHLGRTTQESVPRKLNGTHPAYLTTTTYDEADRVTSVARELASIEGSSATSTAIQTFTYEGMSITTEQSVTGQSEPQTRTEKKGVLGKVQSVIDANGTMVSYIYDPDANLTDVDAFEGPNDVHIEYDIRGRRTLLRSPDMGEWHYTYTSFGELETQTDAEQRMVRNTYDKLGRQTIRRDEQTGEEAKWVYDLAPGAGIGKLAAMVSAPDERLEATCSAPYGLPSDEQRAVRSFTYTPFGEIEDEVDCTDGTTFMTSRSYDQFGRPSLLMYPEVGTSRLTLRNNYTSLGFLHSIVDMEDESPYWTATAMDAAGYVTTEYAGNGVETTSLRNPATGWLMASQSVAHNEGDTVIQRWAQEYDEVGNLLRRYRTDVVNGATSEEVFTYDSLNRLRTSTISVGSDQYPESYDIDARGNITSKAGKGYTYGSAGGCVTGGPHAVCTFDGSEQFVYDANGNMTSGAGRTVTYNLANKVEHIESGMSSVDFVYGADGHRVLQEVEGNGPTEKTIYVGLGGTGKSLYERTARGGAFEHTHFLYAGAAHGGNAFAIKVIEQPQGGEASSSTSFIHSDHLGSVTAVSDELGHVVNAAEGGAEATAAGYDPWGARRSPDGRPADPASFEPLPGHREFTAHEMIPGVGLVNMNGRVYDPELGRFLSADPNVAFEADLQSYNRYAYVLNNPLRYTDPTGFIPARDGAPFDAFGPVFTLIATAACGVNAPACAVGYIMVISYNATAMATSGASFDDIVFASAIGIGAGAIGGVAGDALAKGLGGGAGAQIIGGVYGDLVSQALTTAVMGGNLSSGELFWELWSGAISSSFEAGADSALVSKAYAAEATGSGGSLASDARRAPELGTLGKAALATQLMQLAFDACSVPVDIESAFAQAAIDAAAKGVPELKTRALFNRAETASGDTSDKGKVTVGRSGLNSVGWLQSTLLHESVHVDQLRHNRWYADDSLGAEINQYEAYEAERANADRFGLSPSERKVIQGELDALRFTIYKLGGIDATYRIHRGDYTLPR